MEIKPREPEVKTCPRVRPGTVGAGGEQVKQGCVVCSKGRLETGLAIYPLLEGKLAK